MKRIIDNLVHHKDDYECMWNGIEDIYVGKTNEKIPDQFFFAMSGFCGFAYIKTNKADIKRMVSFNDGRTRQMYKFLSPIVGFDYRFTECKTPELALKRAKKEIDLGRPVVLGALDMYHLEYYSKLYHKVHVPFHYVLMVGYDDEKETICLYDCGREDMLELSYADILSAMNAEYEGLSKPNTICTVRMDRPNSKKHIVKTALEHKAESFINPPVAFLGVKGMRTLAKELPCWEKELGREETLKIMRNMVLFLGSVPTMPNKLLGISEKDEVTFMCSRDKMAKLLADLGRDYENKSLDAAGVIMLESGSKFEELCEILVDYILGNDSRLSDAEMLISDIADLEHDAFCLVLDGVRAI